MGNPIITLDSALVYSHFAGVESVGSEGDFIEMRAEVGLLTRNIVIKGDDDSESSEYGAHVMISS